MENIRLLPLTPSYPRRELRDHRCQSIGRHRRLPRRSASCVHIVICRLLMADRTETRLHHPWHQLTLRVCLEGRTCWLLVINAIFSRKQAEQARHSHVSTSIPESRSRAWSPSSPLSDTHRCLQRSTSSKTRRYVFIGHSSNSIDWSLLNSSVLPDYMAKHDDTVRPGNTSGLFLEKPDPSMLCRSMVQINLPHERTRLVERLGYISQPLQEN